MASPFAFQVVGVLGSSDDFITRTLPAHLLAGKPRLDWRYRVRVGGMMLEKAQPASKKIQAFIEKRGFTEFAAL